MKRAAPSKRERESRHAALVAAVEKALDDLFSDTTVSQDVTRADLSDVVANCQIKMESLHK